MTRRKVIVITGPTASGKTTLSLAVASRYNTHIISADSRQCFIELNIGVAKPSPDQLAATRHYFVNSHSIHDTVTAGIFESYALNAAEEIFSSHEVAVMAGGTGLYIKAFCEGLDSIPQVADSIRQQIVLDYEKNGIAWLRREVSVHDPVYFQQGETQNPRRLMRALEVKLSTGMTICAFQNRGAAQRSFDIEKYALDIPRPQLISNIDERVDSMMDAGLLNEVKALLPFRDLNALQTVGYSELFEHLDGKMTLDEAIARIKINTRQYAKRQMTWLRKDPQITWIKNESGLA